MFVQIMKGKTSDKEGLRRQLDTWLSEVRPGAVGFLGSTGGVTEDGRFFMAARFESEEKAQANSGRPEQGQWWSETEKFFDGPVSFVESSDVEVHQEPSGDAGFVQVMHSQITDRKRLEKLNAEAMPAMTEHRPDVIGAVTVWSGDNESYDIAYFTSEAAAREGEKKEMPADQQKLFEEWDSLVQDTKYLDLKDTWID